MKHPAPGFRAARWVWLSDRADEQNIFHWFRGEFDLHDLEGGHLLRISADTRYRLFVNDHLVGDGPPPSTPQLMYFDEHSLDDLLVGGTNCIAVIARFTGTQPGRRGGLRAEVVDGAGAVLTATGERGWRGCRGGAWTRETYAVRLNRLDPFQEWFDARRAPLGWATVGFDDSTWEVPVVVEGPWAEPVPRDIPRPRLLSASPVSVDCVEECTAVSNRDRPEDLSLLLSMPGSEVRRAFVEGVDGLCDGGTASLHSGLDLEGLCDPVVTLDFGRVVTAYLEIDVEGVAGAVIDIGTAERLIDGRFSNAVEGQFAWRYVLREGRQRWRSFAWRGFRYARVRVSSLDPVSLHSARALITEYPFEEAGRFHSTDTTLNQVYEICRRTAVLCCNESIVDTPWREQSQWLGDGAAVTNGVIYACFGDVALPSKFLRQAAAATTPSGLLANVTDVVAEPDLKPICDFSLWWVIALWRHYEYTGDLHWPRTYASTVREVLETHLAHLDGGGLAADLPGWLFIDWANLDRRGASAPLNAILFGALNAAAQLADAARAKADAASYRQAARRIRECFVPRLTDPGTGLIADSEVNGRRSTRFSEHANFSAVSFGLCDDQQSDLIVDRLGQGCAPDVVEAEPFFTSVILRALARRGRRDLALELIRERWGRRMVDNGLTSCSEEWGTNGSWRNGTFQPILRSLSHAWSSGPAEFLLRDLIDFRILEPGCRRVSVNPYLDLDYEVSVPTPLGPIEVIVEAGRAHIDAPDAVEARTRPQS